MPDNPLKKVLIITYYWPPSAGSGVQRWLKFAKYLPEFGWEPVIFTPENPDFELKDEGLQKEINPSLEVIKFPIWEPYALFRKLKNEPLKDTSKVLEKSKKSLLDKLGIWIRANLIIPDPRVYWVKPSVEYLESFLHRNQIDAIITTGPPHSLHLIGKSLKKKTGIAWFADFRDPWSQWEFLDTLPMTDLVRRRHQRLENEVLNEADAVATISPTFQQDLEKLAGKPIHLLTNGFDPDDLPKEYKNVGSDQNHLEILYTGVIDAIRNPIPFLSAFQEAFEHDSREVKLRFVGKVSENVRSYLGSNTWLKEHVILEGYVNHSKVFSFYEKAHLLLLILTDTKNAQGNIPGKLFEYMATGRSIIALGDPRGDSAQIIQKAMAGYVFKHEDHRSITSFLQNFKVSIDTVQHQNLNEYSRKSLTQKLAQILDEIQNPLS
ncbi:Glycosyltransferase involved in cell wall bisynthesis [Belliella buryatensis]|uniref:Glycosyltransferase involved in cell wall bisynthesis n=1 Tax=Belliella buryatensis TaxID=1500549 RepID=A0A239C9E1_9BACT|nr:glycosyltransferase family 4 protein [Belliella buryatensis]SNS16288.1 Glycosyltransferase involved in cell wall bisynthesis [Belliella buryatensis]